MELTLNQLKAILKEIAEKHKKINGFYWGGTLEAITESTAKYPLLIATIRSSTVNSKDVKPIIDFTLADKCNEGNKEQLDDVHSDTLTTVTNIANIFKSYRLEDYIAKENTFSATAFKGGFQDYTAGWQFSITFEIYNNPDFCGIPIDDSFNFLERAKNYI